MTVYGHKLGQNVEVCNSTALHLAAGARGLDRLSSSTALPAGNSLPHWISVQTGWVGSRFGLDGMEKMSFPYVGCPASRGVITLLKD
jgi:hypothetical protein